MFCVAATQKELKHRLVKHYGYEFKYGINDVDINEPLEQGIPPLCAELLSKAQDGGYIEHMPDQLTVNTYEPGQGRTNHCLTSDQKEGVSLQKCRVDRYAFPIQKYMYSIHGHL